VQDAATAQEGHTGSCEARWGDAAAVCAKGNSIRSTECMTATHHDTIMRLLVQVGEGCSARMDRQMQNLTCRRIQVDEIWSFVHKKQRRVTDTDDRQRVGDMWTFVALDADTKLVPSYLVGKRDVRTTSAFMNDLSQRLVNRVQLSSDALRVYVLRPEISVKQLLERPGAVLRKGGKG
jgi:IS1 family transposase